VEALARLYVAASLRGAIPSGHKTTVDRPTQAQFLEQSANYQSDLFR